MISVHRCIIIAQVWQVWSSFSKTYLIQWDSKVRHHYNTKNRQHSKRQRSSVKPFHLLGNILLENQLQHYRVGDNDRRSPTDRRTLSRSTDPSGWKAAVKLMVGKKGYTWSNETAMIYWVNIAQQITRVHSNGSRWIALENIIMAEPVCE